MKTIELGEDKMAKQIITSVFRELFRRWCLINPEAASQKLDDYFMEHSDEAFELYDTSVSLAIEMASAIFPLEKGKTQRLLRHLSEVNTITFWNDRKEAYEYTINPFLVEDVLEGSMAA